MSEIGRGERSYKPGAVKKLGVRQRVARVGAVAGIVLGSAVTGAAAEGTAHVLSRAVNKVVRTLEQVDNTDYGASSAGIQSQQAGERARQAGIPPVPKPPK